MGFFLDLGWLQRVPRCAGRSTKFGPSWFAHAPKQRLPNMRTRQRTCKMPHRATKFGQSWLVATGTAVRGLIDQLWNTMTFSSRLHLSSKGRASTRLQREESLLAVQRDDGLFVFQKEESLFVFQKEEHSSPKGKTISSSAKGRNVSWSSKGKKTSLSPSWR